MSTLDDLFNSVLAPVANQTDPTKGASLVGYNNDTVKDMLDQLVAKLTNARTTTVIPATTAGQVVFPVPGGYPTGLTDVFLLGAHLVNGVDYTGTDGLQITLSADAAAQVTPGVNLVVQGFGSFAVANAIAASTIAASGGAALVGYGSTTVATFLNNLSAGILPTGMFNFPTSPTIFPDFPTLELQPGGTPARWGGSVRRPWLSTADQDYYVNASTGSDTNDGKTQGTALKTFAAAMSKVPYFLFHRCHIYVMDGTYNEVPVVSHIWMTASRWGNFQVIGHTPNNPAYTDTQPQNVVFSYADPVSGSRGVVVWSSMPGSNYNTGIEGVTLDNFWPYDVTCQVTNCIIQNGGGSSNNYGVGGHGGTVNFSLTTFKNLPANGLVCEATDFAHFHFNQCTLDPTCLAPFASIKNQSVVTCKNMTIDLSTSFCEPGSLLMGGNAPRFNQYGMGLDANNTGYVTVAGGVPGVDTYNDGGQITLYGYQAAGSNAGSVSLTFGSRDVTNTSAKMVVSYSDTTGTREVMRVTNLGMVKPSVGVQYTATAASNTSGLNLSSFVDSADSNLKFRDTTGLVTIQGRMVSALAGDALLTFPTVANGATVTRTLPLANAALGDEIVVGAPATVAAAGVIFNAWVSVAGTITVSMTNLTGASITPVQGQFRFSAIKR